MAINQTAYDTTACASFDMGPVVREIERAGLAGQQPVRVASGRHEKPFVMQLICGGNSFADAVPFFRHPILVTNPFGDADGQAQALAVDVRDFGRWNSPTQSFLMRDGVSYAFHMRRAILNQIWLDGRVETLRDLSTLPALTYTALVSECVGRRFGLDPAEQATIAVLAAFFYYGLFTNQDQYHESELPFLYKKIAELTRVPMANVEAILTTDGHSVPVAHNLDAFCQLVRERVQNVALENFNVGVLLMVTTGNWFGSNSREVLGVSLEHIPTWITVVAASLSSATYKRSTLAKIAQRFAKHSADTNLLRSLEVLLGGPEAVKLADSGREDNNYRAYFHS